MGINSPREAAEKTGFSRQTIMNAVKARELPARKNNLDHWIIDDEDLNAWLAERGPKQNVKVEPEAPDNEGEGLSGNDTETLSGNDPALSHTAAMEEIGRLRALLDARDEVAEAKIEAAEARIADLRAELERRDIRETADRERREAEHRSTVEDLRAQLGEARERGDRERERADREAGKSVWAKLFGK